MRTPWGDSVSIFLIPKGPLFEQVKQQLDDWMLERLIQPSIWISPEDLDFEAAPPLIRCSIHGLDLDGTIVDKSAIATDILASHELSRVRLIHVFAPTLEAEVTDEQIELFDRCSDLIKRSMPQKTNDEASRAPVFKTVNLVVSPAAYAAEGFLSRLPMDGRYTILASAEDRSTPWAGDATIRNDERFPVHIAAQMACAGGVWNGLTNTIFDTGDIFSPSGIHVARVTVNAVLTDGIARRVAARTLEELGNPESQIHLIAQGIQVKDHPFISDADVDAEIERMLDITYGIADGALSFKDPNEEPPNEQASWTLGQKLSHFGKFARAKITGLPYWLFRYVAHSLSNGVHHRLYSDEGMAAPPVDLNDEDVSERVVLQAIHSLEAAEADAKRALVAPFRRGADESFPKLWRGMRQVIFGKLDGTDFREYGGSESERIFESVSAVIQDPDGRLPLDPRVVDTLGMAELNWNNLERTDEAVEAYTGLIDSLLADVQANCDWLIEVDAYLAAWEDQPEAVHGEEPELSGEEQQFLNDEQNSPVEEVASVESPDHLLLDSIDADQALQAPNPGFGSVLVEPSAITPDVQAVVDDDSRDESLDVPEQEAGTPIVERPSDEALQEIRVKREEVVAQNLDIQLEIDELVEAQSRLNDWKESNQRSYLWRFLERGGIQVSKAEAQLRTYTERANSVSRPDEGVLNDLRDRYLRGMFKGLFLLLVTSIVYSWTKTTGTAWGLMALLWLVSIWFLGLPALRRVVDGKRVQALIFAVLFLTALAGVWFMRDLLQSLANRINSIEWYYVVPTLILLVVTTALGVLIPYYRDWNLFERQVQLKLHDLQQVAKNVRLVRVENERLSRVHAQAREWLYVIGSSLNHPWAVDELWHHSNESHFMADEMPHSVRFALVQEEGNPQIAALGRLAAKEFVRPGWRSEIYAQQLQGIQRIRNLPEEFLSVDSVDQDISYSPNGPRQLAYFGLNDPAVLAWVARRQIHYLMRYIQIDGMRSATPPVYETRTNPLADILDDAYEVTEDIQQNWDEFLSSSIPATFSAPPISDDAFHADALVTSDVNFRVKTIVIGPQRLLERLEPKRYTLIPYAEKERLPVDIVIRMDVTPVVPEALLRLGGRPKATLKPSVSYPDVTGV